MLKVGSVTSGALLVAGTAIGAGMLALPIATAAGGFLPACLIYLLSWIFMTATGLLLLEICIWMPKDANMVSMAEHLLGKVGKVFSWLLYLFLFYCLTIAYISAGGGFFYALFGESISYPWATVLFVCIFSPIVYLGTRCVDRVNLYLMLGLVISYLFFIFFGIEHVQLSYLSHMKWGSALFAMPVIFTSFSYQGIIPSLTTYLHRNEKMVRKAIILGTSIPFVVYLIWEFLILGIVPVEGPLGLLDTQTKGLTAVYPLKQLLESKLIYEVGQAFAFFALTTSFLGVTLGLIDFLADGLKLQKKGSQKWILFIFVYIPPTLIAIFNPGIFIKALTYAGGIGCALLLGFLPILMVYIGRYVRKYDKMTEQLPGGKMVLFLLFSFLVFELVIEFLSEFH